MPLLDHFHPPLSEQRHWESFHATWATEIMAALNQGGLPPGYFAETQVHDAADPSGNGGVAVETIAPATMLSIPTVFPDEIAVQVFHSAGGATLVGAIELVSPSNKDRFEARRAFAAKCLAYLQRGVGLLVVDVVTDRQANLHNELIELMEQAESFRFAEAPALYGASYHPWREEDAGGRIETRLVRMAVGQALPRMPLALRGGPSAIIDLEKTYSGARSRCLV